MNALATRNNSRKPLFKFTKFDQSKEHSFNVLDEQCAGFSSTDSLPAKFSSCDDLIECSYGEFETDLMTRYNCISSSDSFAQLNEFLYAEVTNNLEHTTFRTIDLYDRELSLLSFQMLFI